MAYRYQVVSVGMWRGKIKRWNTTFHLAASTSTVQLYNRMQASGWKNPGDVAGACSGGVASIAVYNSTGGAPISNTIYFDWQTPSTWIPYTATAWVGVDPATPLDAAGESAVVIIGNMGALSKTGKPVKTRKFLHAVPSRTDPDFTAPDIPTAAQAALVAQWPTSYMGNPAGVTPVSVSVDEWYGNHQRVRGRRKTVAQVTANAFSGGVLLGTGAAPFPGESPAGG